MPEGTIRRIPYNRVRGTKPSDAIGARRFLLVFRVFDLQETDELHSWRQLDAAAAPETH